MKFPAFFEHIHIF